MTQAEKRLYLIKYLISEDNSYGEIQIPGEVNEQKRLLRALFNIRMPRKTSQDFLRIQDAYLKEETRRKGITDLGDLKPIQKGIYLWQGDITTLRCGAIVNAANSRMLGCFCPNHGCIDNAIHTFAGIQLREACAEFIKAQDHEEETGKAKITLAFNLPCDYVIHTVRPIVGSRITRRDESLLASCYRSCLETAEKNNVKSLAFCCISTGEFHFPNERAAEIAVKTVKEYKEEKQSKIEVIFNVFKEIDFKIYGKLLK